MDLQGFHDNAMSESIVFLKETWHSSLGMTVVAALAASSGGAAALARFRTRSTVVAEAF